MINLLIYELQA